MWDVTRDIVGNGAMASMLVNGVLQPKHMQIAMILCHASTIRTVTLDWSVADHAELNQNWKKYYIIHNDYNTWNNQNIRYWNKKKNVQILQNKK